jgi:hypothetical protein
MRNITELEKICIEYFNLNQTSSGLNSKLTNDEISFLLSYSNSDKLSEFVHICVFGYIGVCKTCFSKTKYINKTKLYQKYCSHNCSFKDKEKHISAGLKSAETMRRLNKKPTVSYTIIKCKECGDDIKTAIRSINNNKGYCEKHKKSCIECGQRHNKSGKCCSNKCVNDTKTKTNIKNNGVKHNLLITGSRPNQIEFYQKKGYSYEMANILLSEFQKYSNEFSNLPDNKIKSLKTKLEIDDISDYYKILYNKINNFTHKEFYKPYELITIFCNNGVIDKYGKKKIYDNLYNIDKNIFDYKIIKYKKGTFGIKTYTKKGEILRSRLEYDFYMLLENNGIYNYKIGKRYPNSTLYYDFYLEDFDLYIEIAGMMNIPEYKENIINKINGFVNLVILENYKEMLEFIQKILNENKID